MENIVIKIGTNALIKNDGGINKKLLADLAYQIHKILSTKNKTITLISSGAVGMGKQKIQTPLKGKMTDIQTKQFYAAIGQSYLMQEYQQIFGYYNINVAQALLTRSDFACRDKYLSMQFILKQLLNNGIIPIINENDVLSPEELDFSDNDQLGAFVAGMLGSEQLIILSDVPGLFTKHPSQPGAQKIDIVTKIDEKIMSYADSKTSSGGTGGMLSKLETAQRVTSMGIEIIIADSCEPDVLLRILNNEIIGTRFKATSNKKITGIRKWLNSGAHPKGKIFITGILSDLIKQNNRSSILAIGIKRFEGDFSEKDVLQVCDENGNIIGHGICKISSGKLQEILEQKNTNGKKGTIVIHTDYFLGL